MTDVASSAGTAIAGGRPIAPPPGPGVTGRTRHNEMFGRETELAAIDHVLESAGGGLAGLLLDGDAGIGKTTIFEATVAVASARDWQVLATRPTPGEAGLSFTGLIDLLDGVDDAVLAELPAPQRRSLDVALLRGSSDDPAEPGAVAVATVRVIRTLARRQPVLIAIDDLPWLDRPTLRTLEFAVRRLRAEPVVVLVSQRSGGGAASAQETSVLAALGDASVTRLRVGPLSLQAVYQLLHERLGLTLGRPALVRVHEASGGNPFFALELARALIEGAGRVVPGRPLSVPERLQDLLRQRIARLPVRTRRVLLGVAAMGAPELEELRAAFDLAPGPGLPEELERAERAGVIEVRGSAVRFTHPLLGSSIYASASQAELRRLHRRLADVASDPEARARHLALSALEPDEDVAAAVDRAAASALARGATDVAAQLADEAVALTPPTSEARYRRALEAGALALAAGDQVRGREHFELALELAESGPARAEALLRLSEVADPLQAGIAMCDRALAETDLDGALQSRLHRVRARITYFIGDVGDARQHAEEGVRLATGAGDPQALAMAMAELGHWTFCGGAGVQRELFERAVALDPSPGAEAPRSHFAKVLMDSGELREVRHMLERLVDEATAQGDLRAVAAHELHLAELEVWTGHFASAIDHADESLLLRQHVDRPYAPRSVRGMALATLGRTDEARVEATAGLTEAEQADDVVYRMANLHVLGFVELSAERYGPAHGYLGPAVDLLRPRWNREFGDCHFLADEIEAVVALGDLGRARDLVGWMTAVAETTQRPWTLATGARAQALLLAAEGDLEAANAAVARALAHHERVGIPLELGRTLVVSAIIQRRRRQRAASLAALRQAEELFERLGAVPWAERARREAERIGDRSAAQPALTPVEARVAGLVAEGRTNREIADRLFVSPKTVEATLTHVYRKLDLRTRTELAAAMSRGGPLASEADRGDGAASN